MANVAEILSAEIVEIPGCPGYGILLGGDTANHPYVRELARTAQMRSGHPWVSAEQTDAVLLAAIREFWGRVKNGWVKMWAPNPDQGAAAKTVLVDADDATIIGLHAHSGISHHMPYGCHLLGPETLAAVKLIAAKPELANRKVIAYLGYGDEFPREHSLLDLVLTEGSVMPRTEARLDVEAFDRDVTRFDSINVRGRSVAAYLLSGKVVS